MNSILRQTETGKIPTFAQKSVMNLTLEGKNALVGGGSAGIGLSAAIELSKLGACVTLGPRSGKHPYCWTVHRDSNMITLSPITKSREN
jgi:hypothetical protein